MNREEEVEKEYSAQHFGFVPDSLKDVIFESVKATITTVLKGGEDYLKTKFPEAEDEIVASINVAKRDWLEKTETSLQTLNQTLVEKILPIPRNIVLPADSVHLKRVPQNNQDRIKKLSKTLNENISEIQQLKEVEFKLKRNLEELISIDEKYDRILKETNDNKIQDVKKLEKAAEKLSKSEVSESENDRILNKRMKKDN